MQKGVSFSLFSPLRKQIHNRYRKPLGKTLYPFLFSRTVSQNLYFLRFSARMRSRSMARMRRIPSTVAFQVRNGTSAP